MTIDFIEKIRNICIKNINTIKEKTIFSIVLNSKDINGGLNFEERIAYYRVSDKGWVCKEVTEKTIQPAWGSTITTEHDINEYAIEDAILLDVLNNNICAEKEFELFVNNLNIDN